MDIRQIVTIWKSNDNFNKERNPYYGLNRVRIHSSNETIEHFLIKSALTFILVNKKHHGVITEAEMRNGRCIDVCCIKNEKNIQGYEINNGKPDKIDVNGIDIVDIPLATLPKEVKKGFAIIEKWLEKYIV
jgi:hypothetical protein